MYWKETAILMTEVQILDEMHRPRVSYTEQKVFCNVKSIGQSEFYQAETAGMKPELKMEVKLVNLENVSHVKHKNKLYKVIRTYQKQDITELTLSSMVLDNE